MVRITFHCMIIRSTLTTVTTKYLDFVATIIFIAYVGLYLVVVLVIKHLNQL